MTFALSLYFSPFFLLSSFPISAGLLSSTLASSHLFSPCLCSFCQPPCLALCLPMLPSCPSLPFLPPCVSLSVSLLKCRNTLSPSPHASLYPSGLSLRDRHQLLAVSCLPCIPPFVHPSAPFLILVENPSVKDFWKSLLVPAATVYSSQCLSKCVSDIIGKEIVRNVNVTQARAALVAP